MKLIPKRGRITAFDALDDFDIDEPEENNELQSTNKLNVTDEELREWVNLEFIGYPMYEVNRIGEVRSIGDFHYGKIISQRLTKHGYYVVRLYTDGKRKNMLVHRLVAFAFVHNPNPEEFNIVNHIDECKTNNRYDNLEWCTHEYNITYGSAIKKRVDTCIENGNFEKLRELNSKTVYTYDLDGNFIRSYPSATMCSKAIGKCGVSNIVRSYVPVVDNVVLSYTELNKADISAIANKYIEKLNEESQMNTYTLYRYNLSGELMNVYHDVNYKSTIEDFNVVNIIQRVQYGKHTSYNCYWDFKEVDSDSIKEYAYDVKKYRKIYQYNSDGELVVIHEHKDADSMSEFAWGSVVQCCNNGRKTYMGYVFSYNELTKEDVIARYDNKNASKPVYCYNLNKELVKEYNSIEDCIRDGFVKSNLHDCFNGKSLQHNGLLFSKYIMDDTELDVKIKEIKKKAMYKSIYRCDKYGNVIDLWDNARAIQDELGIKSGHVHEVCKGKRGSYKGFIWKYAD